MFADATCASKPAGASFSIIAAFRLAAQTGRRAGEKQRTAAMLNQNRERNAKRRYMNVATSVSVAPREPSSEKYARNGVTATCCMHPHLRKGNSSYCRALNRTE